MFPTPSAQHKVVIIRNYHHETSVVHKQKQDLHYLECKEKQSPETLLPYKRLAEALGMSGSKTGKTAHLIIVFF